MIEMIRDTLRKKRDYEAESHFLHHRFNDHRYHLTAKQKICLAYLDEQLLRINIWELLYKGWFTLPTTLHRLTVHLWQK